jgi:hypothetical protein
MLISDFGYVPAANVNNYPIFGSAALDCIRQALGT